MDAAAAGIASVIWATGFRYNFNWVKVAVLGTSGEPLQQRGVSACPGFYFLGLRRMFNLRSNLFEGVGEDAAYIAEHMHMSALQRTREGKGDASADRALAVNAWLSSRL